MVEPGARHAVIIGGGLSGLSAAYDLRRAGWRVTLLEDAPDFGGLASSIRIEGQTVERFYHFICRGDHELTALVDEVGLSGQLHWRQTRTAFYYEGRPYRFGAPLDLLRFTPVPWLQRLRFGVHILSSRYRSQWQWLDQIPARPWLIENIGEQAYDVIWHPLLRVKFGDDYDKISAAWIWHRIWRVARSRRSLLTPEVFGYLQNGSATLCARLVEWLRERGAVLRAGAGVQAIQSENGRAAAVLLGDGQRIAADAVLSTVALPVLDRLLDSPPDPYFAALRQIRYIGVVCMLLNLRRPFSPCFWMNIHDRRISFNGVIEQTNLNHHLKQAGLNLLYVPYYLSTDQPRYHYSDADLLQEYTQALHTVNPSFQRDWIKEYFVFRSPYAQAICTTPFAAQVPAIRTPIPGLYLTDSTQFYPEDRTLSAAIRQGRRAAGHILDDSP